MKEQISLTEFIKVGELASNVMAGYEKFDRDIWWIGLVALICQGSIGALIIYLASKMV